MRRIALIALAALVVAAVSAPSAFAINSILKFDVSFSPTKVGTKAKPQAITLNVRPYYDTLAPDADAPFAWTEARVFFPKEGVFNGKYFPSCSAQKIANAATRPSCKKAIVGKVNAKGFALGLVEPLTVGLYNLPAGKGIALHIVGDTPLIVDAVVEGILTRINTPLFGYKLTFRVPPDLVEPAPGAKATALDFKTTVFARTIKKGKKKYPYVGTTGCPASGVFTAAIETDNTDGTMTRVETTAPCKK